MAIEVTRTSPVNWVGIEKDNKVINTTPTVLKSEYMATTNLGDSDLLIALSHNKSQWTNELTDEEIALMLNDPEITKCLNVVKNGVLGDGVMFAPPISEPTVIAPPEDGEVEPPERKKERLARDAQVERYNLAKKYSDFMTRAFGNLEVSLIDVLYNMLDARPYGNKVAEKVYEKVKDKDFGEELYYLKRLNVKPRKATIFVTDRFLNLIGFKVFLKEKDEKGNEIIKEKIIRKEKFATLTFGSEDGDPRGQSNLKPVYKAWSLKMNLWPEYMRWLIYSAIPPIIGYTSDQTDSRKVLRDVNGEIVTDKDGNVVYESDVGALLKALSDVRNASAIALPYGAKVEAINSSVSGDPFKGFRDVLNEEMEMHLLHQTLATSDSRHNTRAASQTHISILDELVWGVKGVVIKMLDEMVQHLMDINFPNYDVDLVPIVHMGDTSRRDFNGDVGAISQLSISGFIGESQKAGIDRLLGLPPRDAYSDREFERQKLLEKYKLEAELAQASQVQTVQPTSPQPKVTEAKPQKEKV